MEYFGVELKDEGLQHYGVKGMHWGIRRYQPYPSDRKTVRKSTRSVKTNLYNMVKIQGINNYNESAISKKKEKLSKINPAKKKKIKRIKKKIDKLEADKKFLEEKNKEYKKETQKIIDQMSKKGYSFNIDELPHINGKVFIKDKSKTKSLNTLIQNGKKHMNDDVLRAAQQRLIYNQHVLLGVDRWDQYTSDINKRR